MKMRRYWVLFMAFVVMGWVIPVDAAYYLAGDFNGWTSDGDLMTDNGDGTYTATLTGLAPGRYEFKVTDGTWNTAYPSSNSWLHIDASGTITVTFNDNLVSDGWSPNEHRIGVSPDTGAWTIAGSFGPDGDPLFWNNANPALAMTALGRGIYELNLTLEPGTYEFKAVNTGSWDSISWDGRSINTFNMSHTVQPGGEFVSFYLDAAEGVIRVGGDLMRTNRPNDPDPAPEAPGVLVGDSLSWAIALDADGLADPNLVSHKLYLYEGSWVDDPNDFIPVAGWDPVTLRASYTPAAPLNHDSRYFWRVSMVQDDGAEVKSAIWMFDTEVTQPVITGEPAYQVVEAGGTATFEVSVSSATPETYQWYRYVDGVSDQALADGGDISGAETAVLSIANVEQADEGAYYCAVNNESGVEALSDRALLRIKGRIAYWPFENNNADSVVAGSPASFLYHNPTFATGIVGDAMEFDNDPNSEDILYTDPDQAAYFDICNHSMTVACWIKSSFAASWGPMVARNGELGRPGWQLRHSGYTLDHACFTTRGSGSDDIDDGTPSNRAVYDGDWHYVVATYGDGEKKIYIDGVISRVYDSNTGEIAREADAVSGRIAPTTSPVSIGGRVEGDSISGLVFIGNSVSPAVIDEVEIYNYVLDAATIAQNYADITGAAVCPAPLANDLTGDCIVNLNDLAEIAASWLTDTSVQPAP